jgi:O-antigen ligase
MFIFENLKQNSMGHKWVSALYFGFLLLLPLVFCTTIIDPVLIPRQILLTAFLFFIVVVLFLKKPELRFNFKNPLFYAFSAFVFLNFISFFQSDAIGESHTFFSKVFLLFSFFILTTTLLYNNVIRADQLVIATIIFGLITVSFPAFELFQKMQSGEHLLRRIEKIQGSSANKNLLSSILFLCIPFCFIGLQQGRKIRILALVTLIPTLIVLFTIRTRAVLIAVFVFVILLICYKIKQRFSIKKRYCLSFGIVLLLLSFSTYFFYLKDRVANFKNVTTDQAERYLSRLLDSGTLENRFLFWKNSMLMWHDNLLFGVGLGNWQIQFPKYGLNSFKEYDIVNGVSTLQRPHNDFIWILCETGILGLLAYVVVFGIVFYQLYSIIKKAAATKEKWQFYFILSGLIGYMIISFFDFPYERIEHQVILMLLFAIAASAYFKTKINADKNYKSLPYLLLIPIGYSFLVSFWRFNGEQHAVKMYAAKANQNWSETIYESKKASNYFYRLDNTTMPFTWYEGIGHFNENRPEESEACFEKAYKLTPYNIQVITNLASTYQLNGRPDEAIALYNEALKISGNFDEAKLSLAALYFNKKEYDKAFSTINEVKVNSKNPKYQAYLIPILNQKINAYLKTATDKTVIDELVKKVTTKEALLQLFFDAKKSNMDFETYLAQAKF